MTLDRCTIATTLKSHNPGRRIYLPTQTLDRNIMSGVTIQNVAKSFGSVEVIKDLNLSVPSGSFCVFVGPSGCGKYTLLRMIAGLDKTSEGSIQINGKEMVGVEPARRGVAMVFQSYALYPHMTVHENICFGLRMRRTFAEDTKTKLQDAARMLKLDELLDRTPPQLSGGQRQRVAIGRAIVREPDAFLFDEPLSNLDAALRVEMRTEYIRLYSELKATMIYLTHDQVEAMTKAEVIVVMNAGKIEQVGSPLELYHNPQTLFVAQFLGSPQMNTFPVKLETPVNGFAKCLLPGGQSIILGTIEEAVPEAIRGVRPEHLGVDNDGDIKGIVRLAERLGPEIYVHIDIGQEVPVIVRAGALTTLAGGHTCCLKLNVEACHLFSTSGVTIRSGSLM